MNHVLHLLSPSVVILLAGIALPVYSQTLVVSPQRLTFRMTVDSTILPEPQALVVTSPAGNVEFEVISLSTGPGSNPSMLRFSPQRATTPATIFVGLEPKAALGLELTESSPPLLSLRPVGNSQTSTTVNVGLEIAEPPAPIVTAVVNGATRRVDKLSPGVSMTILGTNLCGRKDTSEIVELIPGSRIRKYRLYASGSEVLLNGKALPVTYCQDGQMNAVAPYDLPAPSRAELVVRHFRGTSQPVMLDVVAATPGLFTLDSSGDGPAVAFDGDGRLIQTDFSAVTLRTVRLFATGLGTLNPLRSEGSIARMNDPPAVPVLPVSLTINGQPAQIRSVQTIPDTVTSVLAIEAVLPASLPRGPNRLLLKVGDATNAQQLATIGIGSN